MPKERWFGFIKDYEGGTLMECRISPKVDYLRLYEMLNDQQETVQKAIMRLKPPRVFPGLTCWQVRSCDLGCTRERDFTQVAAGARFPMGI